MIYNIEHENAIGKIHFEVDDEAWIMTPIMTDTGKRLAAIIADTEGHFSDHMQQFWGLGWKKA